MPLQSEKTVDSPDAMSLSLGQLLLEYGEISQVQLDDALAFQRRCTCRLGEALVEQQALSPDSLDRWLKIQKSLLNAAAVVSLVVGCGTASADESQESLWQKIKQMTVHRFDRAPDQAAWGQDVIGTSGEVNLRYRSAGVQASELSRSEDGSLILSVGANGLKLTKRF